MQLYVRFSLGNMTELIAVDFFFPVSWYECGEGSTDSEIITERNRGQASVKVLGDSECSLESVILTHFDTSQLIYMIFSRNAKLQKGAGTEKLTDLGSSRIEVY